MTVPLLFGPYGSGALTHAEHFARYGANACWFHGFNAAAFERCAQHDVAACVEFKTFRADFDARPALRPIGVDGEPIRYGDLVQGVCLSQTDFLEEIEAALLDGVHTYAPRGIWLDYLTYAGWFETPTPDLQESCFCEACIADFCEATGLDVTTPRQILSRHAAAWERRKCERVARLAAHYAEIIRAHHPACVVGAYMCPWTPEEFDGALSRIFAQDYQRLTPTIDVFTPLIYVAKSGRAPTWGRDFLERAPGFVPADRKVQLILDVLDFPASLETTTEAAHPTWGVQVFDGAEIFGTPEKGSRFREAVREIRQRIDES